MASKSIQIKESAEEWQLALPPTLDFAAARQLLKQIRDFPPVQAPTGLCLDFSQTRQIDTAGLGSLLLVGEHFGAKTKIRLTGATEMVRELLDISGIEQRLTGQDAGASTSNLRICSVCRKPEKSNCGATLGEARNCPRAGHRQAQAGRSPGVRILGA